MFRGSGVETPTQRSAVAQGVYPRASGFGVSRELLAGCPPSDLTLGVELERTSHVICKFVIAFPGSEVLTRDRLSGLLVAQARLAPPGAKPHTT
jgi:hypothetical protein